MRARDPILGLRQKLRQAIKSAGFTGTFSTDLIRSPVSASILKVTIKKGDRMELSSEFDGHEVIYKWPNH